MSNIKTMVRGAYDIQQLRIQMGNRIVANFKAKLGQAPGESEEELGREEVKILKTLRTQYKKITDGVKTFPRQSSFKGDEVISDYTELCLIAQYVDLEDEESRHFSRLGNILKDYPIYTEFLEPTKGIGPAMAGVIVSEIDIHKAQYASSIWAYAGLDTVTWFELKEGIDGAPKRLQKRHPEGDYKTVGPKWIEQGDTFILYRASTNERIGVYGLPDFTSGAEELKHWGAGRSRKKESLVEKSYIDKDGKEATRVGITFNPFLKTKLMGVLSGSFLRAGNERYAGIYADYKARLEVSEKWKDRTKGHRHNAALRYMMKSFLTDLYVAWRQIEGLPVAPSYQEAKALSRKAA